MAVSGVVLICRRRKRFACVVSVTTLFLLVIVFSYSTHIREFLSIGSRYRYCKYLYKDLNQDEVDPGKENYPIIVWWNPLGDYTRKIMECPKGKCFFTASKKFYDNTRTAAYLFYASNICWRDLPVPRQTDRVWAVMHEESPRNNWVLTQEAGLRLFNYTATFSRYSDFPLTTLSLEDPEDLTNFPVVPVSEKNKFRREGLAPVAYLQSNCNPPSDRESYVAELMNYINVDSYGKCLHNKDLPPELTDPIKGMAAEATYKILAKYKFVLAFENAICEDYITEKLWRPLHVGSVPVIRGSPSVQDWLPDKKSGIIVNDFSSPKELAEFLLSLDKDDEKYEEYLKWKKEGITNPRLLNELKERPWSQSKLFTDAWECSVCDRVYEQQQKKKMGERVLNKMASKVDYNCHPPARALDKWTAHGMASSPIFYTEKRQELCSRTTAPLIYEAVARGYSNAEILDYLDNYHC